MAQRPHRHPILVVPLQLESPPSAGEHRATGAAVEREEATAEPAAEVRKRTSSRLVAAAATNLPDEIVVWEVFLRLPSKAILRCGAACRSWRVLTSARDFLLAHHRRQPSHPLVALNATEPRLSTSGATPERSPPILGFDDHVGWKLHASCDGLLLLSLADGHFSICNPATRQCAPLPGLTSAGYINIAALYHHPSDDYRVLYWKKQSDVGYYVLHVRQGRSPRCIEVPSPDMAKAMRKNYGMSPKSWAPPIRLHGRLHWNPAYYHDAAGIVVFDMVNESFQMMPGPADAITTTSRCTSLHVMDGLIGFSSVDDKGEVVKIWVLEDYESGVWSFRYQIELPVSRMPNIEDTQNVVLSQDGNMLVCHYYDYCSYMFHCDENGKLLKEFRWGSSWRSSITGHWFKESLVKHAFFPSRSRHCVKQPYYFRRL